MYLHEKMSWSFAIDELLKKDDEMIVFTSTLCKEF